MTVRKIFEAWREARLDRRRRALAADRLDERNQKTMAARYGATVQVSTPWSFIRGDGNQERRI